MVPLQKSGGGGGGVAQHVTVSSGFNLDLSIYVYLNNAFLCSGSYICSWMAICNLREPYDFIIIKTP